MICSFYNLNIYFECVCVYALSAKSANYNLYFNNYDMILLYINNKSAISMKSLQITFNNLYDFDFYFECAFI